MVAMQASDGQRNGKLIGTICNLVYNKARQAAVSPRKSDRDRRSGAAAV
jgi:hypothetical protein